MSRTATCLIALVGILVAFQDAGAALLPAKADLLKSTALHQDRPIDVYLPEESTKDPKQRFETLYVLDGDWNTKIVTDVVDFMRQLGMLPPMIVVSVPNPVDAQGRNSRDHDLTPSPLPDHANSGGAADFLRFLRTELVPYVNQHYPTNGVNLIHGHSYGGLFLIYIVANDPQLFDGYLILDPAMWWDQHSSTTALADKLAQVPTSGKSIYIAGRSGAEFKEMGLDGLQAAFRTNASPALHWKLMSFEDESHDSLKLKGTYDGLKYLYGGYTQDPVGVAPDDGIVIKGRPIRLVVSGKRVHLHYTQDGSEPTETSPADEDGAITIDNPENTRIKLLSNRGVFDRDIPLHLKTALPLLPSATEHGYKAQTTWHFAVYQSDAWPDLSRTKPTRQGSVQDAIAFNTFSEKHFALRLQRRLLIPEDGYYVFFVDADQARLKLNDSVLISDDGKSGHRTQTYLAPLRRGTYSLSIDVLRTGDSSGLHLGVIQYHDKEPVWWNKKAWLELDGQ